MLLLLLLLTSTTSITALGQALRALKMPEKLCLLFFFTHRQLHSISELYQRMQAAAKLRCFEPKLNYKSIKTLANLGIKLILQSLVRSESIEKAMRLRLFSGVFPCIYAFKATNKDKICLLCSFCLALLLLYLDRILI